ncbi:hypothetical protein [Streptomyces ossamyceticus]|uniref:hypothetical protein n=1 Tax=Streptomyces ossamyceticus TaxID=249581 RepID=UPI00343FE8FD
MVTRPVLVPVLELRPGDQVRRAGAWFTVAARPRPSDRWASVTWSYLGGSTHTANWLGRVPCVPAGADTEVPDMAKRGRARADHAQVAAQLRAQPGEWGPVSVYPAAYNARKIAVNIRLARDSFGVYGPAGAFEARTQALEDGTLVEARYIADQAWADALAALPTGADGTTGCLPAGPSRPSGEIT